MLSDSPILEPDDDKIRLFGDRYLEMFSNGFEYSIRRQSSHPFHREDGPASYREYPDGVHERYFVHGNLHREDGPAEIYHDYVPFNFHSDMPKADHISEYMKHTGRCRFRWFWQDRKCSFKEWLGLTGLSENDHAMLLLKYVKD